MKNVGFVDNHYAVTPAPNLYNWITTLSFKNHDPNHMTGGHAQPSRVPSVRSKDMHIRYHPHENNLR